MVFKEFIPGAVLGRESSARIDNPIQVYIESLFRNKKPVKFTEQKREGLLACPIIPLDKPGFG